MKTNIIYNEDCIGPKGMCLFPDKSIDMILCDLPYGTTACSWDIIIPFEALWKQYKRIIKDNGAIALTANQPFTSLLVVSNITMFKYNWVWNKNRAGNFVHSNYQPLRIAEDILIFGKFNTTFSKKGVYNYSPQMEQGAPYSRGIIDNVKWNGRDIKCGHIHNNESGLRFPKNIIAINNVNNKNIHTTQKPVALFGYLIKTYTKENDIVLDNCIGSGTTAIACNNTNRKYIGFEKNKEYFNAANRRINFEQNINELAENLNSSDLVNLIN